jgi:hypothetical protein
MNLLKLDAGLKKIVVPEGMKAIYMIILAGKIVDHTTMEYLHNFQDRTIEAGHTCVPVGMEHFRGLSDHALAYRVSQVQGTSPPLHDMMRRGLYGSVRREVLLGAGDSETGTGSHEPVHGWTKLMRGLKGHT